ncbi:MAG: hypothetical protein JO273_11540 [Methylobacteriaceae bacterium]|nr:hypothetical protein [Methylobacteriaceae bacterium]
MGDRQGTRAALRPIIRLAICVCALVAAPLPARAADDPAVCRQAAVIVELANFLISEPPEPPRFWRNRYADDAAYLAIRYGKLSREAGSALLKRLGEVRRKSPRIDELRLAFADRADRVAMFDALVGATDNGGVLVTIGPSAMRAMLLDGDGARLYAAFDRWRATSPAVALSEGLLAEALFDLDDGQKSRLAAAAEAAGEGGLARQILIREADLGEWLALLKRAPDGPKTAEALEKEYRAAVLLYGRRTPLDLDKLPADMPALLASARRFQAQFGPLEAAAALSPRLEILITLLNQTGEDRIASVAATNLVRAIKTGTLDAADGDAVVAQMVAELVVVLGQKRLRDTLYPLVAPDGRPAIESFDRAVVRHALGAFARGETGTPPPQPATLSPDFPWQDWIEAARARQPAASGKQGNIEDRSLAFEIDSLRGDFGKALEDIQPLKDWKLAYALADSLMHDLDWRCSKLLGTYVRPTVFAF